MFQNHALEMAIEDVENISTAQKVALEIIGNISCVGSGRPRGGKKTDFNQMRFW